MKKAIEPVPKCRRLDPEAGKHFISDEIVKNLSYLEIGNSNTLNVRHSNICPLMVLRFEAGSHFYTIVAPNINTSAVGSLQRVCLGLHPLFLPMLRRRVDAIMRHERGVRVC